MGLALRPPLSFHRPLPGVEPVGAGLRLVRPVWSVRSSTPSGAVHPVVTFSGSGAGRASSTTLLQHCRALGDSAMHFGCRELSSNWMMP